MRLYHDGEILSYVVFIIIIIIIIINICLWGGYCDVGMR